LSPERGGHPVTAQARGVMRALTMGGNSMTNTGTDYRQDAGRQDVGRQDAGYGRRPASSRQGRGIFISTEARPGFITSEFWLTILGVVALGVLAYASDALGVRWGMGMAVAILVAYVVSRGIAKAGSSDIMRTPDGKS